MFLLVYLFIYYVYYISCSTIFIFLSLMSLRRLQRISLVFNFFLNMHSISLFFGYNISLRCSLFGCFTGTPIVNKCPSKSKLKRQTSTHDIIILRINKKRSGVRQQNSFYFKHLLDLFFQHGGVIETER